MYIFESFSQNYLNLSKEFYHYFYRYVGHVDISIIRLRISDCIRFLQHPGKRHIVWWAERVTELDSWSSVKKSKHEKRETCEVTKDNCLNDVTLVLDFSRETEYKKD